MISEYSNIIEEKIGFKRSISKKIGGVYLITNILSGKTYVGSSYNLYDRIYQHYKNIDNKKHTNRNINFAGIKYGINVFEFEILKYYKREDFNSEKHFRKVIIKSEQFFIDTLNSVKYGYNFSLSASHPYLLEPWNKGKILGKNKKLSESKKYKKTWNSGIKYNDELILKTNKSQLKPVLKYDLNNNFICEYISTNKAARENNICVGTLRTILNGTYILRKLNKKSNPNERKFIWKYK